MLDTTGLKYIIMDNKNMYVVDLPLVGEMITNCPETRLIVRREWRMRDGMAYAYPVYYSQAIPEVSKVDVPKPPPRPQPAAAGFWGSP